MADEHVYRWRRDTVTVSWDKRLCIHVGECIRAEGELFEMGRSPWCKLEGSSDERVREVVARCPTGALAARVADATADEKPPAANTVTVADGGPLYFHGELELENAPEGSPGLARRAALCRCGRSKNKPYCDNSHATAGFDDHGAVGDGRGAAALEERGGPLAIRAVKDGPLRISGNLTIRSGSGREAWQGTATALCRCGLSGNKPFCDGSHRREGWTEDG